MLIFIIMLVHNTCNHRNGYVEIEKLKCNINVIISSHHASISIIIILSKIMLSYIIHFINIIILGYTLPCRLMYFTIKNINDFNLSHEH